MTDHLRMEKRPMTTTAPCSMARLYWLALGTFAIGTEGFMIAPLLPALARDLSVSLVAAGQLVTVFALTYALSSPGPHRAHRRHRPEAVADRLDAGVRGSELRRMVGAQLHRPVGGAHPARRRRRPLCPE